MIYIPTPLEDETRNEFITKHMNNDELIEAISDEDRRYAYVLLHWKKALLNKIIDEESD